MSKLRSSIYRFIATATLLVNQNRGKTTYEAADELHDATVDSILNAFLQALPEEKRIYNIKTQVTPKGETKYLETGWNECLTEIKDILNEARKNEQ